MDRCIIPILDDKNHEVSFTAIHELTEAAKPLIPLLAEVFKEQIEKTPRCIRDFCEPDGHKFISDALAHILRELTDTLITDETGWEQKDA